MKKNQLKFAAAAAAVTIFSFAKPSLAAVRCETQYGGGEVCIRTGKLQVDKKVWNPVKNEFVDNINVADDFRFKSGDEVRFKIIVKNVGDDTLENVNVKDFLPTNYLFFTGETPSEFNFRYLNPGVSQEMEVKARVKAESQLPKNTTVCVLNTAEAKSGDENDKDTAQLCIGPKVLGVSTLPKTGSFGILLSVAAAFVSGFIGFILIRFNRKP